MTWRHDIGLKIPQHTARPYISDVYFIYIAKLCCVAIPLCFSLIAHHSRKERERRPQVVRRSAPDSGVLIRLKAQMAEVRSKMSDVKSQVMEARASGDTRPGPSGAFNVEEIPSHHGDSELSAACCKPGELDLLGRAAVARSRPCRPGEDFLQNAGLLNNSLYVLSCVFVLLHMHVQPGNLCPPSSTAAALWL